MPTYTAVGPDGSTYEIDGPEGASDAQIVAAIQSQLNRGAVASDPTADMSFADTAAAGIGKVFHDLGTGARQVYAGVADAVAPRQQSLSDLITGKPVSRVDQLRQEVADTRQLEAPLMNTTGGKVGNFVGNVALTAPMMWVPGANTVAGASLIGAGSGLLQPSTSTAETLTNTGLGAVLGGGGQKAGQWLGGALPSVIANRAAKAAQAQAENSVRDETMLLARQLGYKIPPATINQRSTAARAIESRAGKNAMKQTSAVLNQRVTNRLVRQELGLSDTAPLRRDTLKGIRKNAGKVYEVIKGTGRIITDDQYQTELANLTRVADEIVKDFPKYKSTGNKEIIALQESLNETDFSANSAIEVLKQLRADASDNLKWNVDDPSKKALGSAQQEAAGILEEQILRHLRGQGLTQLADDFGKARTLIAKTWSVQSALNDSTGNVIATKLSAQLKKDVPLSGNLEKIARVAGAVDNTIMGEQLSSPGVSNLVASLASAAAGGGVAMSNPALVAGAVGLPLVGEITRRGLLTKAGQRVFAPTYSPRNELLTLLNKLSPATAPIAISVGNSK